MRSYGAMECDPPPVPERHLVIRLWCHLDGSAQFDQLVLPPCLRSFDWSISIWYCTANLMGHHFGNAESASILRTCPSQRSCVFSTERSSGSIPRSSGILAFLMRSIRVTESRVLVRFALKMNLFLFDAHSVLQSGLFINP